MRPHTHNGAIFLEDIKRENDQIRSQLMKQHFWEINGENYHIKPHNGDNFLEKNQGK